MKKKQWKQWAVDHIRAKGRCPGDHPAFGMATDLVTHEEFLSSVEAAGTHPYDDCHLLDEMMGIAPPAGMQIIETDVPKITERDRDQLNNVLKGDQNAKTVEQLKKNLGVYVELIKFKSPGVLYVPEPLIKLDAYIKKFFDVEA